MQKYDEELEAIHEIIMGTADATGERFFKEVVRHMTSTLGVRCSFVSVFTADETKLRVLAFWDGTKFCDVGEYDLAPTPCSQVVKGDVYHCPRDVQKWFPNDEHLVALDAKSYRGVPLIGPSGRHTGHLAVLDTKPMEEQPRFIHTMQIFATRAAAELERVQAENALADSLEALRNAQANMIASKRAVSQGRLAAALSHELNNALAVLVANRDLSELQLDEILGQREDPEAIARIVASASDTARQSRKALQRIIDLVNRLKRFTHIDRAERRLVDIKVLLEDAIGVLRSAWSEKITVLQDYAEDTPLLLAYPSSLSEVFSNILSNAADALVSGGEIRVTTRYHMGYVQVRIQDTGPGIEHDRLGQIFEPGLRVKGGRVATGWGLFISRQIVHDHDGEFLLVSEHNQGTEIEIRLPVARQMLKSSA